ncbi:hypothetical protein L7F22_059557 [Adiantum nelumboides]|nr:hypothetical protein [Adiantum nelumboides]
MRNMPRKRHNSLDEEIAAPQRTATGSPGSPCWFTLEELALASDNFSSTNLLGEGGFGCIFKGILHNGLHVAIKQLKVGGAQGDREFQAEVETISRVHHKHLVSLVGYCTTGKQRLLVYHFVQNQTLEYHLHCQNQQILKWPTRLKIALGAAQGLAYLHEDCHPRIIHRDIKASNILLDNDFNAVVSDFGLAKLTSEARSHITTRVMGTFGYLAPEYALTGKLTEKSDVYSFGVLLLEIITGRKPVDSTRPAGEESLVDWARTLLTLISTEEDLHLLADPLLEGAYEPKEMFQMITAAAACVRHSSSKRPPMRKGQGFHYTELAEKMGINMDEMGLAYTASMASPGHEVAITPLIRKFRLHIQGYVGHEEFLIMPLESSLTPSWGSIVLMGDNHEIPVAGTGRIILFRPLVANRKFNSVEALYVPDLAFNLLSVVSLDSQRADVHFDGGKVNLGLLLETQVEGNVFHPRLEDDG